MHTEFPELKNYIFERVCFGCGGISGNFAAVLGRKKSLLSGVLIGPKSLSCFSPLHVVLKFMPHTAARYCKKQQQQKTPRAQQYAPSLLIQCADGKLNAKHHRTTPKSEIHITLEKAEAALSRKWRTKMYTSGTAAVHHPPRRRLPPTRQQATNYWVELVRVCRLDVVAVAAACCSDC